ncbi:hypothetical protein VTL71DRAFT_7865 [Oculimacula yallundae]|uniref:Uncharacterized protein n=1 Tax=Oculimacula yallundae TaxID=86028 RepID=A0ABR4CWX9_9HELO
MSFDIRKTSSQKIEKSIILDTVAKTTSRQNLTSRMLARYPNDITPTPKNKIYTVIQDHNQKARGGPHIRLTLVVRLGP